MLSKKGSGKLAWQRVAWPSVEVAPLHQLWAWTCGTERALSGRDGQPLIIADFWQKDYSLWSRWTVGAATVFAPGRSVLHVPIILPSWEKALPKAKANLCFSLIHSFTSVQDKLILQKMAFGDGGFQQAMRNTLIIKMEEIIPLFGLHTKTFWWAHLHARVDGLRYLSY